MTVLEEIVQRQVTASLMKKPTVRVWQRLRCWWRGHVVHLELDAGMLAFRCLFCGAVSPRLDGSTFDPCLVHDADERA